MEILKEELKRFKKNIILVFADFSGLAQRSANYSLWAKYHSWSFFINKS